MVVFLSKEFLESVRHQSFNDVENFCQEVIKQHRSLKYTFVYDEVLIEKGYIGSVSNDFLKNRYLKFNNNAANNNLSWHNFSQNINELLNCIIQHEMYFPPHVQVSFIALSKVDMPLFNYYIFYKYVSEFDYEYFNIISEKKANKID